MPFQPGDVVGPDAKHPQYLVLRHTSNDSLRELEDEDDKARFGARFDTPVLNLAGRTVTYINSSRFVLVYHLNNLVEDFKLLCEVDT